MPGLGAPHGLTTLSEVLRSSLEISDPALELAQRCEDARERPFVAATTRELAYLVRVRADGVGLVTDGQVDERPDHRRQGRQRRRALDLPLGRHCAVEQLAP